MLHFDWYHLVMYIITDWKIIVISDFAEVFFKVVESHSYFTGNITNKQQDTCEIWTWYSMASHSLEECDNNGSGNFAYGFVGGSETLVLGSVTFSETVYKFVFQNGINILVLSIITQRANNLAHVTAKFECD